MLGASDWPPPNALIKGVCALGYENLGEAGVPERLYLRRRADRAFNAHIVKRGSKHWNDNLALRDFLRDCQVPPPPAPRPPWRPPAVPAAWRARLRAGSSRLPLQDLRDW